MHKDEMINIFRKDKSTKTMRQYKLGSFKRLQKVSESLNAMLDWGLCVPPNVILDGRWMGYETSC